MIISAIYIVNKNIKQENSKSKPDIYMEEQYDLDNN